MKAGPFGIVLWMCAVLGAGAMLLALNLPAPAQDAYPPAFTALNKSLQPEEDEFAALATKTTQSSSVAELNEIHCNMARIAADMEGKYKSAMMTAGPGETLTVGDQTFATTPVDAKLMLQMAATYKALAERAQGDCR
jgi:hypothetical protein